MIRRGPTMTASSLRLIIIATVLFRGGGGIPSFGQPVLAFSPPRYASSPPQTLSSSSSSLRAGRRRACCFGNAKLEGTTTKPRTTRPRTTTALSSSSPDDDIENGGGYRPVEVAGVSVSPSGFLVLLRSTIFKADEKVEVAFPVRLTSPPDSSPYGTDAGADGDIGDAFDAGNGSYANAYADADNDSNGGSAGNVGNSDVPALPSLFRENSDQTSVTSPEALTFLQLLNGVDMATPILPPDTLSSICVHYAFSIMDDNGDEDVDGEGSIVVEDELGLSGGEAGEIAKYKASLDDDDNCFKEALDYIRSMVRTTLPLGKNGTVVSYTDASSWQRARVKLPRAWLHGVRVRGIDRLPSLGGDVGRVPLRFTLECSVDDGSKLLEVPLFVVPSSSRGSKRTDMMPRLRRQIRISDEILQELSNGFRGETSAAFVSLALFHRYNKSGAGSADSPTLKVSAELLGRLRLLQRKEDRGEKGRMYCWTVPTGQNEDDDINNNIDAVIRKGGLPLYRTLDQIREEDQRVLRHLGQQNFGKSSGGSDDCSDGSSIEDGNASDNESGDDRQKQHRQRKKTLTLEQQATRQRLKSAWKVAVERKDEGAQEKIRGAMEELEREVMENPDVDEEEGGEEGGSALEKIQRAMRRRTENEGEDDDDVVGLISELEEAAATGFLRTDESDNSEEEEK